ncbi:MAG: acylneuraminate cytidylyltransferase family protein [Myxococcaceae bacterium]|nr:acylneuraminate cytidylyltransferase family protein [Myxococcaceae bacterium]
MSALRVLAVIPARGGSKGVPGKNIKPLGPYPLIAWTIRAAMGARSLSRVVVSTDDERIAQVAREHHAEVPFMRPLALATDSAKSMPVMQHALETIEKLDRTAAPFDAVMMLQPTTPFRTSADIDAAVALLTETNADSVISVVDVGGHHPARMKYLEGNRLVDPVFCEAIENQPRQELRPMYLRNGAIYLTRRATLRSGSFKGQDCRAWVMPEERSVNIDTARDFQHAELLLKEQPA